MLASNNNVVIAAATPPLTPNTIGSVPLIPPSDTAIPSSPRPIISASSVTASASLVPTCPITSANRLLSRLRICTTSSPSLSSRRASLR